MKHYSFNERFGFALNGLKIAWKSEESFRMHFGISVLEIAIFLLLGATQRWKLALFVCVGAVLAFELVNTALEHLLDLIEPKQHPSVKAAKDCAAAAVLVMSLLAGVISLWFLCIRFKD